jgi:DNA-binding transcriptional MerR regulator
MVDPKKLYRSGEITHFTGVSRQTLHIYNQIGLIREIKTTGSGQKLYDESIFRVLETIKKLQREKLTLLQIKKRLNEDLQMQFTFIQNLARGEAH